MNRRTVLATAVALLAMPVAALAVTPAIAFAARGPAVTVRVEGLKRTLLLPDKVHARSGWITRFGAPSGQCPARSAQGALDVATKHRWHGIWSTQFGPEYEITSILGETHRFSSNYFWEIFVNDVAASTGACELKLHRGEQILFAAVPDSGTEFPLALEAPRSATAGQPLTVKVVYFTASGAAKALGGAHVSAAGHSGTTNSEGMVTLTPAQTGRFVIHAKRTGYVRAAPVTVDVS